MMFSFERAVLTVSLITTLATGATAQTSNSPMGFNKQLQIVFEAYKNGDGEAMKSRLETFAVPEHWFVDVFGPDQVVELKRDYHEQFAEFESHTVEYLLHFDEPNAEMIHVAPRFSKFDRPELKPDPVSIRPLPEFQSFLITYEAKHGVPSPEGELEQEVQWEDTFIYVDGQFRFIGGGAYLFWDPARTSRQDPCGRAGVQIGGQPTRKIEPIYPVEAERKHVQGLVKMHLTVSENGSVEEARVVQGDPLLVEAAKEAVMKWHYQPLVKCGVPVQMHTWAQLEFSLP